MSESEEMYLVTIARLKEASANGPVPLSLLAAELDVLPVSANQMIRKLEEAGLVEYMPYKGVELTPAGERCALQTLRHRRLWEVFLVEKLKFNPNEASELSCKLEHSMPEYAAERLADFLGNPLQSPEGKGIPHPGVDSGQYSGLSLSAVKVGQSGLIRRIEANPAVRSFLDAEGLSAGTAIKVIACGSQGSLLISTSTNRTIHLTAEIVQTIWVDIHPSHAIAEHHNHLRMGEEH